MLNDVCDVVLECPGAAPLVFEAMRCVGPRGLVCLPGVSSGRRLLRVVATGYGLLAGVVSIGGIALLVRRRTPSALFVVLTGFGMLLPPLIFFGDPRFHVPAVPIAAIAIGVLVASYRRETSATI